MIGETIALGVAISWTVTALFAEVASKRMGSLPLNTVRMSMSLILLAATLWLSLGAPYPRYADGSTWMWLLLSGLVGYTIGDYCLMQGYIMIGSRIGQLFMTLAAPTAAVAGYLFIGERMPPLAVVGMVVTLMGIGVTVLSRSDGTLRLSLPWRGVVYAAMAGICQGAGLVLSKIGLSHYEAALAAVGLAQETVPSGVALRLPIAVSMPFAATMIRAIMGLAGFALSLFTLERDGAAHLRHAVGDSRAMWCTLGATIFGPFIGVSASLIAVQHTSSGIAQTLFALTPVLIIAPSALLFHQRVTLREVIGTLISMAGVVLFFVHQ